MVMLYPTNQRRQACQCDSFTKVHGLGFNFYTQLSRQAKGYLIGIERAALEDESLELRKSGILSMHNGRRRFISEDMYSLAALYDVPMAGYVQNEQEERAGTRNDLKPLLTFVSPDYNTGQLFLTLNSVTLLCRYLNCGNASSSIDSIKILTAAKRTCAFIERHYQPKDMPLVLGLYVGNIDMYHPSEPFVGKVLDSLVGSINYHVGVPAAPVSIAPTATYAIVARVLHTQISNGHELPEWVRGYEFHAWRAMSMPQREHLEDEKGALSYMLEHANINARKHRTHVIDSDASFLLKHQYSLSNLEGTYATY